LNETFQNAGREFVIVSLQFHNEIVKRGIRAETIICYDMFVGLIEQRGGILLEKTFCFNHLNWYIHF
jgi:hypothetical protein